MFYKQGVLWFFALEKFKTVDFFKIIFIVKMTGINAGKIDPQPSHDGDHQI